MLGRVLEYFKKIGSHPNSLSFWKQLELKNQQNQSLVHTTKSPIHPVNLSIYEWIRLEWQSLQNGDESHVLFNNTWILIKIVFQTSITSYLLSN